MRCPYHLLREVVGYCNVCGEFGCGDCLTEHEGQWLCKKHYKPIADQMGKQKRHEELLTKPERQRLVVHTKDGKTSYGICFAMNHKMDGFHLDLLDDRGEPVGKTEYHSFSDLKAVFYVKTFDGKFDEQHQYKEWHPQGNEVVVEFLDGEVMHGHTFHVYRKGEPRFFLIPSDHNTNNISVLIEASAVKSVLGPEEYKARRQHELDAFLKDNAPTGRSQDELMGDFHFEHREYGRAMKFYQTALENGTDNRTRLRKKMASSQYNVGVRHIKQHDYVKAFSCMKAALESDPANERAKEKYEKLKQFLKKKSKREPTENIQM
ncbi:MAG: hypothetical protein HYV26_17470 [Candidatus Hydrogenedentes bacterium]|nr:hypothetical protein [Candidatus Hydrogenedentota bacterium]MBI3117461.1 hypothetical protein [Candidatus Hydrogenedentota bacterium]